MIKKIKELEIGDKIILKEDWRMPCDTVVNGHHYIMELCPVEVPSIVLNFRKLETSIGEELGISTGWIELYIYTIDRGSFHELRKRVEDYDKTESSDILMVEESTKNKRRIIKPFNLDATKNGARIETKEGERAHFIKCDGEGIYKLKFLMGKKKGHGVFNWYTLDGKAKYKPEMDLVIVEYEDIESV